MFILSYIKNIMNRFLVDFRGLKVKFDRKTNILLVDYQNILKY